MLQLKQITKARLQTNLFYLFVNLILNVNVRLDIADKHIFIVRQP